MEIWPKTFKGIFISGLFTSVGLPSPIPELSPLPFKSSSASELFLYPLSLPFFVFFRKCETNSVARRKGATLCPASREHCVQPSPPPVICSPPLFSHCCTHQWLTCSLRSHRFLPPPGYKIMNRSVFLFISVGGGYNKGFRLCSKGFFFLICFSIKVFLLKHPGFFFYLWWEIQISFKSFMFSLGLKSGCFLLKITLKLS